MKENQPSMPMYMSVKSLLSLPGVTEHSDLTGDVAPVPGSTELLQPLPQTDPHVNDPVRHHLDGPWGSLISHDQALVKGAPFS